MWTVWPPPSPTKSTVNHDSRASRRVGPLALRDPVEQRAAQRRHLRGRDQRAATPTAPPTAYRRRLGAGVVGVAELRAVRRRARRRCGRRRSGRSSAAAAASSRAPGRGAACRRPPATTRPSGRGSTAAARGVRRSHLPGPGRSRSSRSGRCRRRTSRRPRTTPRTRDRHVVGQLLHGEVGAEVVRDRVEAAGVHEPGAGLRRGRVVGDVHRGRRTRARRSGRRSRCRPRRRRRPAARRTAR